MHSPTPRGVLLMEKHFIQFYSPGTFVSETDTQEIDSWDTQAATNMARSIHQRHGATPYGFRFITKSRGEQDLDSKVINSSGMYYLGGKIRTYEEVVSDNLPDENILRDNMKWNNFKRIIVNTNSWKFTAPLYDEDIVLSFEK